MLQFVHYSRIDTSLKYDNEINHKRQIEPFCPVLTAVHQAKHPAVRELRNLNDLQLCAITSSVCDGCNAVLHLELDLCTFRPVRTRSEELREIFYYYFASCFPHGPVCILEGFYWRCAEIKNPLVVLQFCEESHVQFFVEVCSPKYGTATRQVSMIC